MGYIVRGRRVKIWEDQNNTSDRSWKRLGDCIGIFYQYLQYSKVNMLDSDSKKCDS